MNAISDSLIEKLEELYPKPKVEVATVKEEPVAVTPSVPDYTITSGGSYASGNYAIQSTNSGSNLPLNWGTTAQSNLTTYDENSLIINSAGGNTYPLPIYVQKIAEQNNDTRVTVLDQMKVKETSGLYETTLKQYIDCKMIDFEFKIKDHIRQEIDKLKCNPGTHI